MIKKLLLIFILSNCLFKVFSQSFPFRNIGIEDGLPSSKVFDVKQDSKGYMWFATDCGVCRYDGYKFEIFNKDNGLPENDIMGIFEDHNHKIWFLSRLAKLSYLYKDSIHIYKYNNILQKNLPKRIRQMVNSFYVSKTNEIYFSCKRNGLLKIDSLGRINNLYEEKQGVHIIKQDSAIILRHHHLFSECLEDSSFKFSIIDNTKNKHYSFNYKLLQKHSQYIPGTIAITKGHNSYFYSNGNLLLQLNDSCVINNRIIPSDINRLSIDKSGNLLVTCTSGVYFFEKANLNIPPKLFLLDDQIILTTYQDREGGYWFATFFNGIYYLPNLHTKTISKKDGLPANSIHCLAFDKSSLWLGDSKNNIVNIRDKQDFRSFTIDTNGLFIRKLYYSDTDNKLWILETLKLYSFQNNLIKKENPYNYSGFEININNSIAPKDISQSSNGTYWLASFDGLYFHNDSWNKINEFNNKNIQNTISIINDSALLIGCENGLWKYNVNDKNSMHLGTKNEILKSKIKCIEYNKYDSTYYIGTKNNGLILYNNDTVINITQNTGLSSNNIKAIQIQKDNIWIATNKGINKLTIDNSHLENNFKIRTYSLNYGIPSEIVYDILLKDSLLYVATKKGLAILDYKNLEINTVSPKIHINKISILQKDTLLKKQYILPYNQNSISISYVGLMYKNSGDKKYKYKLIKNNRKTKWENTTDTKVNFSFLSPGEYTFIVKAINEDNFESETTATVSFNIKLPYWKSWWFISILILLALLFVIGVLYSIHKIRIKEINKRNTLERDLLQQINKFRQQALNQQMNPHFIFNTLNSIQYYIVDNDIRSSTKYLAKFSRLIRIILENSQYDTIPIDEELKAIKLYVELENVRIEGGFNYNIHIDKKLDTSFYKINPLLFQPFVENAIWHGLNHKTGHKQLNIELIKKNDNIAITIEDNGIGREKAAEIKNKRNTKHKSLGTNITGKRIDVMNKLYKQNFKIKFTDLKDKTRAPLGTRVVLNIPKLTD